ncbi:Crp/Fnr family transcriptional regulator [Devosia sp. A16]|uniref:Crp/Fnr family transcriptional regulator n=1 Tax=Devosia sp. A16 TaxID=1736675 RepID=UPI0018D183A2|nr:Crp/Fnr family transcriptional regulator [Devosia sp. A16]
MTDRLVKGVTRGSRHGRQEALSEVGGQLQIVLEGAVLRQRFLPDGRCQTVAVYHRDDVINLSRFVHHGAAETDLLVALKGAVVGTVNPEEVERLRRLSLRGVDGMAALVLRELAISQERLVSLGRRSATEAMAHFMCETLLRSRRPSDNCPELSCSLAMSQDTMGTVLGLSSVHVNRTLQELRQLHLADHSNFELVIYDFDRLAFIGGFDDGYLTPV